MRRQLRRWRSVGIALALVAMVAGCKQLPPSTFAVEDHDVVAAARAGELADVTGDGVLDLVVAGDDLAVLPGLIDGGYAATPTTYELAGSPWALAVGDLDADGAADVVVGTSGGALRWEAQATGLVAQPTLPGYANAVAIADVTGDGLQDLLTLGWGDDLLTVHPQQAGGLGLGAPVPSTVDVAGYNDLAVGDVDGDGDLDVVAMSGQLYATPDLTVLLQGEDGTLTSRGTWSLPGGNVLANGVAVGQVDRDGPAEVVVSHGGNRPASTVTVFEADETGGLVEGASLAVRDIPTPVALADLNGDGYDDAVVGHSAWSTASILYGGPQGLTEPAQELSAGNGSVGADGLDVADADADGDLDVLLVSYNDGATLLTNTGVPPGATTSTSSSSTTSSTSSTTTSSSTTSTSTSTTTSTTVPQTASRALDVATGWTSSCALLEDGTVACWGKNTQGQLGDGTFEQRSTPTPVVGLDEVVQVDAGASAACAVRADTTVWCWGWMAYGLVGTGLATTTSATPVVVPGLDGVEQVSVGNGSACALLEGGAIQCWGSDGHGELGDGPTPWTGGRVEVDLPPAVEVAVGSWVGCALLEDGTVQCWGNNSSGQVGDGTTTDRDAPTPVLGLADAVDLSVGSFHACALVGGDVRCWGNDLHAQLGDGGATNRSTPTAGTGATDLQATATGGYATCGLAADGTARCWGTNHGKFADGTTAVAVTPATYGVADLVEVDLGLNHSCARTSDGAVWCSGINEFGALGDGTTTDRTTAVRTLGPASP